MMCIDYIHPGSYSLDMEKTPRFSCQGLVPRCKDRDMDVRVSVRGNCLKGTLGRLLDRYQDRFPKNW